MKGCRLLILAVVQSVIVQAKYFKKRLFYVVNGLDRGSSASAAAVSEVEATVASLLSVSSPVELSWAAGEHPHLLGNVVGLRSYALCLSS